MKQQFSMKGIPGDVWLWLEQQAYMREMDINALICGLLEHVRTNGRTPNPISARAATRQIVAAGPRQGSLPERKEQYCLRSIPQPLWAWLEKQSARTHQRIKNFIVEQLRRLRDGDDQASLFDNRPVARTATPKIMSFRFIDLFAGIGGFRLGLQNIGGKCVFTSEWDRFSAITYQHWFGDRPHGDITQISPESIPEHDVLAAGFPCQPFSIAGVSKKNSLGHKHGFDCERQGNLFFSICDIAKVKRPPAMILENVKNLRSHDKGRTWCVIRQSLQELGYTVADQIIDASGYVPQHRERIFIVCFRSDVAGRSREFSFPLPPTGPRPRFRDILEDRPDPRYILTDHLWDYLQRYAEKHKAKGNGFGFGLTDLDGVSRTLSARYYKDGSEVLIPRRPSDPKNVPGKNNRNPRRLTPVEAAWLMGFRDVVSRPEDIPVSDTQAYRQFGNAVVPAVVEAVGTQVLKVLASSRRRTGRSSAGRRPSAKRSLAAAST